MTVGHPKMIWAWSCLAMGCSWFEAAVPPTPEEGVTFKAPESACVSAESEATQEVVTPERAADLEIQASNGKVSLEASGVPAGKVLVAAAHAAQKAIVVRGSAARLPVYVSVKDEPIERFLSSVASSVGLQVGSDHGRIFVADASEMARLERERRASALSMLPVETRVLFVRHALEIGEVAAAIGLSCAGRLVAVRARGMIVVTDRRAQLDLVEELVRTADDPVKANLSFTLSGDRRSNHGVTEPPVVRCVGRAISAPPSASIPATGTAAGDFLRALARTRGEQVVVGCGGDAPVYIDPGKDLDLLHGAQAAGLAPLGGYAYGRSAFAEALNAASHTSSFEQREQMVKSYAMQYPTEATVLLRTLLSARAVVVPYKPTSVVFVRGAREDIEFADDAVRAWRHPNPVQ